MMEDFLILILLIGLFIIANIRTWLTFKYIMHKKAEDLHEIFGRKNFYFIKPNLQQGYLYVHLL